jgi:hypothetical protein
MRYRVLKLGTISRIFETSLPILYSVKSTRSIRFCRRCYSYLIESNGNSFLRFTPLPNKWSRRSPNETYTGRPKRAPSLSYYKHMVDVKNLPAPSHLDVNILRRLINDDPQPVCFTGADCTKISLIPGDMVETCTRDGQTSFGVVTTYCSLPSYVPVFSMDGIVTQIKCAHITAIFRGTYKPKVVWSLFEMVSSDDVNKLQTHLCAHMKLFVKSSLNRMNKIAPFLQSAYAHVASSNSVVGVSLSDISSRILKAMRSDNSLSPELMFAVYLSMSVQNLNFARPCSKSPFVAIAEQSVDSITKIMQYLTDHELTSYVNTFSRLISGSEDKPVVREMGHIIRFLQHYVVFADSRLEDAVSAVLSKVYPDRDSDVWLTAPSSVQTLLCDAGLTSKTDPFLVPGSVAWPVDGGLTDGLDEAIRRSIRNRKRNKKSYDRTIFGNKLPVYYFQQADDIGFSLDQQRPDLWTLYIHIPDLATKLSSDNLGVLLLTKRAKSWNCDNGKFALFPESSRDEFAFSQQRPTDCLTMSIKIPVRQPFSWTMQDAEIKLTSIFNPRMLDGEELDNLWEAKETIATELRDVSRSDSRTINELRSFFDKHFWHRIQQGAIYDAPMSAQTFSAHQEETLTIFKSDHIIREARLCAGSICSLYSTRNQVRVPFVKQGLRLSTSAERRDFDNLTAERRSSGCSSLEDRIMVERYLGPEEISNMPMPHVGLGLHDGFVDIAHPFDDMGSLAAQWPLCHYLEANKERHEDISRLKLRKLQDDGSWNVYIENNIQPQREFIDIFVKKLNTYKALRRLEEELRQSRSYYIFRCRITEETRFPDIGKAFCHDLGLTVNVALLPGTSVHIGDTLICTEIVELDPVDGLLVLGM